MENNQQQTLTLKTLAFQKEISWIEEVKQMAREELNAVSLRNFPVGKVAILEAYKKNDEARIKYYENRLEELRKVTNNC